MSFMREIAQIYNKKTADENNFPFIPPYCAGVDYYAGLCPRAEDLLGRNIAIDISPLYGENETDDIVRAIEKVSGFLLEPGQ